MARIEFKSVSDAENDILKNSRPEEKVKQGIAAGIVDYLVNDVIMPNSKTLLYETIRGILNGIDQTVQQAIFKEVKYNNFKGSPQTQTSYVSYDSMWNRNGRQTRNVNQTFSKPNLRLSIMDLTFRTRMEAQTIFDSLCECLDFNGMVTVNDLCAMLHIPGSYTDVSWGWRSTSGWLIEQTPNGWYLNLTNPTKVR